MNREVYGPSLRSMIRNTENAPRQIPMANNYCICGHDISWHGVNLNELTAEYRMDCCFADKCTCWRFQFREAAK